MKAANVRRGTAFTFVEVLAALVFLAILVPAVVEGLVLSNRLSVYEERSQTAAELAENKLDELLIDSAWESTSDTRGDFGKDMPGYRWELEQASWQGDTVNVMTQLTMHVYFLVQGQEHDVSLSTLVNSSDTTTTQQGATATPL